MNDGGIFAAVTKDCELTYTGSKFICVCKKDGYLSQCAVLGARMRIVMEAYEATKTKENETMSTPSAYVAEYAARDRDIPLAYAETLPECQRLARAQVSGADRDIASHVMRRTAYRMLTADEASEVAEYFATAW
jgi:hypothetical protein